MRFKKLRLFIGIALILFIFIAGNIIAFGKLVGKNHIVQSDNPDQNIILVDPKQIAPKEIQTENKSVQPKEIQTENKSVQPVEEVQNTTPPEPIEQPKPEVVEPTPHPEPVVVHHRRRRTRAS